MITGDDSEMRGRECISYCTVVNNPMPYVQWIGEYKPLLFYMMEIPKILEIID